jgi:hypothetical protein
MTSDKRRAKILFKRLKVGLVSQESLSNYQMKLLRKHYPFLFR